MMIYAWDVRSSDDGIGACGVSYDHAQALADLLDAIVATPVTCQPTKPVSVLACAPNAKPGA